MTQSHRRRQGVRGAQEKCSLGSHHLQHGLLNWEMQRGDYEGESGSYQNSPKRGGIGLGSSRVGNWREKEKFRESIGGRIATSDGTETEGQKEVGNRLGETNEGASSFPIRHGLLFPLALC